MYSLIVLLHVLAATIWTGGHLVLAVTVLPVVLKNGDLAYIRKFESGYEKIGIPALMIQVVTGIWMVWVSMPNVDVLFQLQTPVAKLFLVKIGLLLATMALAADARIRIIPNLNQDNIKSLAFHVIPVTLISVLFVCSGVLYRFGWFN